MDLKKYRYSPHTEDTKILCSKLEETLPNVTFKFVVDGDGLLRMRAFTTKPHKDKEVLLRDQSIEQVVGEFVDFFGV